MLLQTGESGILGIVYVDAEHIIEWLSEHDAVVVGPEKAGELRAVLDALPWIAKWSSS